MAINDKDLIKRIAENSLINVGNNYRIKTVMEKAMRGEKVTIVYLGASITEGIMVEEKECFTIKSYNYFSKNFGVGNNVKYVNAGVSGTDSVLGLIRADRDVLEYEPDIIFVEFAVNDTKNNLCRATFEALVAKMLTSKTKPIVILLFAVSEVGYTCQGQMKQIGIHYDLPMISIKEGIIPEINANQITWKDYSDDLGHPNNQGHSLITEMINHYFETAYKKAKDTGYKLSEKAFYGLQFQSMVMLDSLNANLDTTGGFKATETIAAMKNGWVRKAGASMESFLFNLQCRSLFVVYKESSNIKTGTVEVYVDGKMKLLLNGYNSMGWDNPVTKLVFHEQDAEIHTIEIKVPECDAEKEFTILGFGYCSL